MAYAVVNPTGCTERYGLVQVRLDLCLEPGDVRYDDSRFYVIDPTSKLYLKGYSGKLDAEGAPKDAQAYAAWEASLPRVWMAERCFHHHIIYLDPYTLRDEQITAAMALHVPNFYKAWVDEYDKLAGGMRHGWDVATRRPRPTRFNVKEPELYVARKAECLSKVAVLKVSPFATWVTELGETFPSTDIDVGSVPADGGSSASVGSYTYVSENNAANDTGAIDTVDVWIFTGGINSIALWVGTFSKSSSTFTVRDSQNCGAITKGSSQQVTGLDITVNSGDFIGAFDKGPGAATVGIEWVTSGGAGVWAVSGEHIDPTDSATYTEIDADSYLSLYGTGETAGGEALTKNLSDTMTIGDSLAKATGKVRADSVAVADVLAKATGKPVSDVMGLADSLTKAVAKPLSDSVPIVENEQITVGSDPTDRLANVWLWTFASHQYVTWVDGNNPASAACVIHTVRAYMDTAAAGNSVKVGTFHAVGNVLTCISAVAVGEAVVGLNEWTGLELPIAAGDYIGIDARADVDTAVDASDSGYTKLWRKNGQFCDPTDSATFDVTNDYAMSLQAVGSVGPAKAVSKPLSESFALADALSKAIGKPLSDSVAIADVIAKEMGLEKAEAFALADAAVKAFAKNEADTVAIADSFSRTAQFNRSLSDTLAIADSLSKATGKPLSDMLPIADAIVKETGKAEADVLAITDSLTKAVDKALSESFGLTDSLSKAVDKPKADTMAIADAIAKAVGKPESDSLAIADVIAKTIGKNEVDSVGITDSLSKAIGIIEHETMVIADSIVKALGIEKADTVTSVDAISKGMSKPLSDAIAFVDSMVMTGSYARPGINIAAFLFARAINALLHERDIDSQLYPRDINAKHRREF